MSIYYKCRAAAWNEWRWYRDRAFQLGRGDLIRECEPDQDADMDAINQAKDDLIDALGPYHKWIDE